MLHTHLIAFTAECYFLTIFHSFCDVNFQDFPFPHNFLTHTLPASVLRIHWVNTHKMYSCGYINKLLMTTDMRNELRKRLQ